MTRPETHADLTDYQRRGTTLFSWQAALAEHPEVEQWIVKAKLESRKLGFEFDYNEIRVPLTHDELQAKLVDEQEKFDKGKPIYSGIVSGRLTYSDLDWSEKNQAQVYARHMSSPHPEQVVPVSADEEVNA